MLRIANHRPDSWCVYSCISCAPHPARTAFLFRHRLVLASPEQLAIAALSSRPLGSGIVLVSQPEYDSGGESDCREKYLWAPVIAGRHTSPILEPAEHNLDPIAPFVAAFVIFDGDLALLSTRDTCAYPFVVQGFSEPIGVVASISEQPFHIWYAAEQSPSSDVVANLPGANEQVERATLAITDSMQLGIQAYPGSRAAMANVLRCLPRFLPGRFAHSRRDRAY